MSWDFVAAWPIRDASVNFEALVEEGVADLYSVASSHGALVVGDPLWEIRECDDEEAETETELVAVVNGVPAKPTVGQLPAVSDALRAQPRRVVIRHLAAQGITDRTVGGWLGVAPDTVRKTRDRYEIPPAVPQGYRYRIDIEARRREAREQILAMNAAAAGLVAA